MMSQTPERELGRRLKAARAYAGLSMKDIGERIGKDRTTWSHYEDGRVPREKRQWLIEEAARVSGLPHEFFEADLQRLPQMMECVEAVLSQSTSRMERLTVELRGLLSPEHQRTR